MAVLAAAALDGVKKKTDPGPPMELNVYKMSYEERKAKGIVSLPEAQGGDRRDREERVHEGGAWRDGLPKLPLGQDEGVGRLQDADLELGG